MAVKCFWPRKNERAVVFRLWKRGYCVYIRIFTNRYRSIFLNFHKNDKKSYKSEYIELLIFKSLFNQRLSPWLCTFNIWIFTQIRKCSPMSQYVRQNRTNFSYLFFAGLKGMKFSFLFYKKGDELLVVWYLDCWFEMENCEFGLFQEIFTFFNFFFKMPNRDKNRTAAQSPFWTFSFEFRKITIQCNIRPKFGTFEPK